MRLYTDRDRLLVGTDPDGRDLVISCGTALHHLRVALAAAGVATTTERLPDPEDAALLEVVRTTDRRAFRPGTTRREGFGVLAEQAAARHAGAPSSHEPRRPRSAGHGPRRGGRPRTRDARLCR